MYCRYCGKKTKDGVTVCTTCAKQHTGSTKMNGIKFKTMILVSAILLLIAASIIALAFMHKSPEEKITENMNILLSQEKEQLDPESVGTKIADAIYGNVSFEVLSANSETAVDGKIKYRVFRH